MSNTCRACSKEANQLMQIRKRPIDGTKEDDTVLEHHFCFECADKFTQEYFEKHKPVTLFVEPIIIDYPY